MPLRDEKNIFQNDNISKRVWKNLWVTYVAFNQKVFSSVFISTSSLLKACDTRI